MRISTIKNLVLDALKSLKRNKTIMTASVITVTATLFILGVFLLTVFNVNQGMKEVASQVEIKVYLKDDISITDKNNLENQIKNTSGVLNVTYETKGQALNNLRDQLGNDSKSLTDGLEKDNPMPNSYIIKVEKPEDVTSVVNNIKDMNGIDQIKDGEDVVHRLVSIIDAIKWIGVVIFIVLIGVSLFLIGNTIRLTVYSRRREIGIMKFIGATDWFIRWPFIIEGMIIGLIGSILSIVILYYGYNFVYNKGASALIIMKLVSPSYIMTSISWEFILYGIIIGALGSILSMRRFLNV